MRPGLTVVGRPGLFTRLKGTWKARREAEPDPRRAPHFPLVRDILRENLPSFEVRLRDDLVADLATRLVALEPSPVPLIEEPRAAQIVLLATRAQLAIETLEADQRLVQRRFSNFSNLYSQIESAEERQRLMEEYLVETVSNRREQRKDIAALRRYMGIDALRERNSAAMARLGILIELALRFIEQGLAAAAGQPEAATPTHTAGFAAPAFTARAAPFAADAPAVVAMIRDNNLIPFLAERIGTGDRWQTRLAATEAVRTSVRLAPEVMPPLELAEAAARNLDEHVWVQTAALEIVWLADRPRGHALLRNRLFEPQTDAPPSDFLARSRMLRLATTILPQDALDALLTEVVNRRDRSEHVRVRVCDLVRVCRYETALALLTKLAAPEEESYRVRASACIAARLLAVAALDEQQPCDTAFVAIVTDTVEREKNTMVIDMLSQEIVEIVTRYRQSGALARIEPQLAGWLRLLLSIGEQASSKPRMAESAAAAAESIDRELDEERQSLTAAIYRLTGDIRPGEHRRIPLRTLEERLLTALTDPERIGRALADLTRKDWGLSFQVGPRHLMVWRGDHFQRRAWRVLHEVRHRAPNKRQAYLHTIGRVERGAIRAHPGGLDEVTATTVPGERVFNDAEGSWGRHLPTVDDVLDLPLFAPAPVRLFSSYGVTTLTAPASGWERFKNRLRVTLRYRKFDDLRRASLSSTEPRDRRRYLQAVFDELHVRAEFSPYAFSRLPDGRPAPPEALTNLFPIMAPLPPIEPSPEAPPSSAAAGAAGAALALIPWEDVQEFFSVNSYYFLSPSENSQIALALFAGGLIAWYVSNAFLKRASLVRARKQVPLCIGGWGTRGKSGTERIKAALFYGLGYEIFVKTTGCEAMLIHSAPGQAPTEIFIYRPYDKATIWEQADMLHLGQRLDCDVFLWECMALNPRYVELLAHEWMRDDINTLTNAYPDHEDIQGPAGINVAEVIASYIPYQGRLFHSELNFQPLFREVARQRNAQTSVVGEREGNLIADDMLDLFPYREHPRNIALSTQLAGEFGIDPELAQATMAEHVVPDLGVLKVYPPVRIRGRRMGFINGCSANERTGFIACWRRMGLDDVEVEKSPGEMIVIVVNNRADRIARSEVFSRILARDVAVDRFVLIGTNLKGLWGFTENAIDSYLADQVVVDAQDLQDRGNRLPLERLVKHMLKLRIPAPDPDRLVARVEVWAKAAGYSFTDPGRVKLREAIAAFVGAARADKLSDPVAATARAQADTAIERGLGEALSGGQAPTRGVPRPDFDYEILDPATVEDLTTHVRRQLARVAVRAGLEAELDGILERGDAAAIPAFAERFKQAYRQMFLDSIIVVDDPATSGDRIIQICATSVPPGTRIQLMGCQNIKGTGLDFVYRWLAIERMTLDLKNLDTPRADKRLAALNDMEAFEDHGVYDTGLAREVLAQPPPRPPTAEETAVAERVRKKVEEVHNKKRAALTSVSKKDSLDKVAGFFEGWVDYLDSVSRRRVAKLIQDDLVAQRISHNRASLEMRKLVGRMKGGWLAKALRRKQG